MDGFLLKNGEGILGLAIIDEMRTVEKVAYLSDVRNLNIRYANGDAETLQTEVAPEFEASLFGKKEIFIGHFPRDGFDKEPLREYYVPLEL